MMKRAIKIGTSMIVMAASPVLGLADWIRGRQTRPRLTILYYHAVPSDTVGQFTRQMRMLARRARVVAADWQGDDGFERVTGNKPVVAITFDDAQDSIFDNALPVLASLGLPCTIFVPSGCMGHVPAWEIEGTARHQERVVDRAVLMAWQNDSVTIGSHTQSHPRLTRLPDETILLELVQSKADLAALTGTPCDLLAFPYGDHDARVVALCRQAAYRHVYTIEPAPVDPRARGFARGRVAVEPGDGALEFWLKATGAYRWMAFGSRNIGAVTAPSVQSDAVTIRPASLDDFPAIQEFLYTAYGTGASFKTGKRWRWQFIDNPVRIVDDGHIPVWIALCGDKVVGQIAVQPGLFQLGEMVVAGGWIVDVMILPAYRGQGLGHRLYEAVASRVPFLIMLTMAEATRRMATRAGAVTLNRGMQFSRWGRLMPQDVRRHVLQRLGGRARLGRAARVAFGGFFLHHLIAHGANGWTRLRGRLPASDSGTMIEEIGAFGAETDAFWQDIARHSGALAVRDSAYLNWRFVACPDMRYRCFIARRGTEMAGYSVLRRTGEMEKRQGVIADILVRPGDSGTFRAFVIHAIGVLGPDLASIECVTADLDQARTLRRLGFWRTRVTAGAASAGDGSLRVRVEGFRDHWHFTKGDHDWDQIYLG
jgi:peptidoglycan/xylan/chitin deacetylase (PgdA/CDA1 family)/GNAT superfamily N-acetyltransferase